MVLSRTATEERTATEKVVGGIFPQGLDPLADLRQEVLRDQACGDQVPDLRGLLDLVIVLVVDGGCNLVDASGEASMIDSRSNPLIWPSAAAALPSRIASNTAGAATAGFPACAPGFPSRA